MKTKFEEMKKQTIGVEVEMNNITRENAAKMVAQLFGNTTAQFEGGGYYTWTCKDQKGRTWKFMRDGSIEGPESEKCEMVTPILTYEDIDLLQEVVRTLRKAGAKSDYTRGCGVHIHIGADLGKEGGHNSKTLRNLTNIMASHETLLKKSINIADSRYYRWCKPVDHDFLKALNKKKPTTMDKFYDIWYVTQHANYGREQHYNDSRYHMLNFHATHTKGTIEFRCFQFDAPRNGKQNGLHAGQLKAYIQLCLALSNLAKTVKGASAIETQQENPKYAMRTWLLRLGFIGDEFKTAREVLTSRLDGDCSFRHGRP